MFRSPVAVLIKTPSWVITMSRLGWNRYPRVPVKFVCVSDSTSPNTKSGVSAVEVRAEANAITIQRRVAVRFMVCLSPDVSEAFAIGGQLPIGWLAEAGAKRMARGRRRIGNWAARTLRRGKTGLDR